MHVYATLPAQRVTRDVSASLREVDMHFFCTSTGTYVRVTTRQDTAKQKTERHLQSSGQFLFTQTEREVRSPVLQASALQVS